MIDCIRTCAEGHASWEILIAVFVVLLPSLVTGLTRHGYGRTGKLALLLRALDRISVLAHRDATGTLKLPGKRSEPLS